MCYNNIIIKLKCRKKYDKNVIFMYKSPIQVKYKVAYLGFGWKTNVIK